MTEDINSPEFVQKVIDELHLKHLKPVNKKRKIKNLMCGPSMKPTMGYVNWVWGEENPDVVNVGDVVGFYRKCRFGDKRIVHRVIKIENGIFHIKGDNAPEIDRVPITKIFFKLEGFKKIV